jgi:arginine decarboxylase
MIILVTGAAGRGPTQLAAFDAALVAAGVADRNLIYLSSVLPPASSVQQVDQGLLVEHHSDDEVSLRRLVRTSLDALARNRDVDFPFGGIEVVGVHCVEDPVCALVVAVFESAAWSAADQPTYATASA